MKISTQALTGNNLNWAVATALGGKIMIEPTGQIFVNLGEGYEYFTPDSDDAQAGAIMDRFGIGTLYRTRTACRPADWFATADDQDAQTSYEGESFEPTFMVSASDGYYGPTRRIAAMRCFVGSRLGSVVDVPDELVAACA